MADIKLQSLKDIQDVSEAQSALDHARSLRGKSARAIAFQLTAGALKNLSESQELADIRKTQWENLSVLRDGREHLRLAEERTRNLLDEETLAAPLNRLSKDLRGYEQKSSSYFLDKRYRHPARPTRLYGCLG